MAQVRAALNAAMAVAAIICVVTSQASLAQMAAGGQAPAAATPQPGAATAPPMGQNQPQTAQALQLPSLRAGVDAYVAGDFAKAKASFQDALATSKGPAVQELQARIGMCQVFGGDVAAGATTLNDLYRSCIGDRGGQQAERLVKRLPYIQSLPPDQQATALRAEYRMTMGDAAGLSAEYQSLAQSASDRDVQDFARARSSPAMPSRRSWLGNSRACRSTSGTT